ncbi:hypothetical protein Mal15_30510 [Stieleria maiorica]|uniref:Uncharacterized protein n=1 Tax=Stieleria maiorica TaxID=2795974 RepID=A0A5B9MCN6_9BACT|nr:hypothetical protein [Stieleria maiorica]QEF98992.1 hypothetical protein Mal15_30510 [Stieleria maiorica]
MNRTVETIFPAALRRGAVAVALAGCVTFVSLGVRNAGGQVVGDSNDVSRNFDELTEDDSADAAPISKDDVLDWVDQLDARKASDRRAAEKALIEAGADALPFLPESRPEFSIEASERLSRVRAVLMTLKTKRQAKAIRIRLGDAKTLGDALEAISRESRIEFEHSADESLPIQCSNAPLSFWHAVDLVLDQTQLDINHYGGDRETLQLVPRQENRQSRVDSAAYSGVYRIEPTAISARRVYNRPEQSGLNLSMEITWQPGMTPIGLTIPVAQLSGKLDDGQTLKPQTTENTIDIAANSELAFSEFYLPLELPTETPVKIDSLRGTIQSLLPGKRHSFELPLNDVGADQTVDAMTVKLERVARNGGLYEVRFSVELKDADRALESHRQWIFQNPVYVLDAQGNRVENLGYELYRQSESGVGMGYLFEIANLDGAKLVYESPTSVVRNEVDFVLQDIPLP